MGHKRVAWRDDLTILERLPAVERLHHEGKTNVAIARALGVDEKTIRTDLGRIRQVWLERIGKSAEELRAEVVAEVADVRARALDAAVFDEVCERAVLFGLTFTLQDGTEVAVKRDDRGAVQFRGNKAASLNVARQASMDKAKILGLVVDKTELAADATILDTLRAFGKGS